MAKQTIIRKNIITNEWEHLVIGDDNKTYWSPNIGGNDSININSNITNIQRRNDINELLSYEDITQVYDAVLTKILISDKDYTNKVDTEIRELVTTEFNPIINKQLTDTYGDILKIAIDYVVDLIADVINPEPLILNLATNDLTYDWKINDSIKSSNTIKEYKTSFDISGIKTINYSVYNSSGKTESLPITVNVIDYNTDVQLINNLIKNPDASSGFKNWEILKGNPVVYPVINGANKYGLFYPQEFTTLPTQIDNTFNSVDVLNHFSGGDSIDENKLVTIQQTIDLSNVIDYVDGNILGISGLVGNFECLMGTIGVPFLDYYPLMTWNQIQSLTQASYIAAENAKFVNDWPLAFINGIIQDVTELQIQQTFTINSYNFSYFDVNNLKFVKDYIKIQFNSYDENSKELSEQILNSNQIINKRASVDYYNQIIQIPTNSRTLKITVEFHKDPNLLNMYNYRLWEDSKKTTDSFRNACKQDHLTGLTALSLKLKTIRIV